MSIVEHHTPCQSIREYPQATSTYQEEVLYLSAKQYIPLNRTPQEGDVTILAAHASAFPKELYEPLWEDLLKQSEKAGYGIRSIWMADVANQGASYVLNEGKTGNDRKWWPLPALTVDHDVLTNSIANYADHARDLLCLINTHRSEFTRPIIGVGHSMGTISLSLLAQMHPRLLTSIVMLDAIIVHKPLPAWVPMTRMPSFRRDLWPSRQAAEAAFRKNVLLKPFDPRVVDKILQHSIRPTPTLLYPEKEGENKKGEQSYTLTTPKHQEALSIARPNYEHVDWINKPDIKARHTHPDIWPCAPYMPPFYKSEGRTAWMFLPYLRPSVLWLYGTKSYTMDPIERSEKMKRTGTEWNGSGGAAMGRVKEEFIEDTGHFLCFEKIKETAEKVSEWLDGEVKIWKDLERVTIDKKWHEKDVVGRQCMDENWLKGVKAWKGDAAMPLTIATMSLITREDLPLAIIYFFLSFYHQPLAYLFLGLRILYSIFSGPDDSSKKQPTTTTTSSSSSFFSIDLEFVALGLIYHYLTNLGLYWAAGFFALRMIYVALIPEGEVKEVKRFKVYPDWRDERRWHYVYVGEELGWKGWWIEG
ncbi:putative toxin biosynthesis protein [Aureobasidium pullulans]|uniref:Putative toxin biosynthesis protein n=1 Tax=Aureobasidium pullulans TaxID=5580 RepID=A0A4S9ADC3_AURPU|nr:putative toxin biosynthesis protein [Aureobasidium pullulans]